MPASAPGEGVLMSAKTRPPFTRLVALAAFVLAAGLFSLRVYDTFGGVKSEPVGSAAERELTYLLEPVTGAEKVRVSVTGRADRTILVMIDGEIGSDLRALRSQVENILVAAIGYDPATDTLTLTQFPFARGVGSSLTALQIAELTGLGLLSALLFAGLIGTRSSASATETPVAAPRRDPVLAQPARLPAPETSMGSELNEAAQLAESKPNETASLVRGWLSYAEE
jgi:flagellar biosynthesis/type III secretory pathway M-ring protein FliF/YscJ